MQVKNAIVYGIMNVLGKLKAKIIETDTLTATTITGTASKATSDANGNNIIDTYALKTAIPTKLSQLTNDSGYITSTGTSAKATADADGNIITTTYAKLASPIFTGTPVVPTATTGDSSTQIANTQYVQNSISAIVNSAPETLNTLKELATALGSDPNFATTMTNQLATKVNIDGSSTMTGQLKIGTTTTTTYTGLTVTRSTTSAGVRCAGFFVNNDGTSKFVNQTNTSGTIADTSALIFNESNLKYVVGTSSSNTKYDIYHSGNLTKISQLTNDSGYITSSGSALKATQDGSGNVITTTYANKPVIVTTTWTASSTTLTVTNSAITATSLVTLGVPTSITGTQYDALGTAEIICTAQSAGSITLTALGTAPTVDIPIELTIVG